MSPEFIFVFSGAAGTSPSVRAAETRLHSCFVFFDSSPILSRMRNGPSRDGKSNDKIVNRTVFKDGSELVEMGLVMSPLRANLTVRIVILVGGGDPAVRRIAGAIVARRPHLADWAPTIAPLLGVDLGRVDGKDLLR